MPFLSIEPLLENLGDIDLTNMAWVIVGGESGYGARPLKREWVRNIRSLCRKFKVPFFFKQWGGVRKCDTGRVLDGRTYDEFPSNIPQRTPPEREVRMNAITQIEFQIPTALGQVAW
jgi:protein gp37